MAAIPKTPIECDFKCVKDSGCTVTCTNVNELRILNPSFSDPTSPCSQVDCKTVPCQAVPCLTVPCKGCEERPTDLIDNVLITQTNQPPAKCQAGQCRSGYFNPGTGTWACETDDQCVLEPGQDDKSCIGGICRDGFMNKLTGEFKCSIDSECVDAKNCVGGLENLSVVREQGNTQDFASHLLEIGQQECAKMNAPPCTRIFVSTVNPVDGSKAQAIYRCGAQPMLL
jgi:hypothetical protein